MYSVVIGEDSGEEVRRFINFSFSGSTRPYLSRDEVVRLWSLEFQWFSPSESTEVLEKMVESGWLLLSEQGVSPIRDIETSLPPLGWRPILRKLLNPPAPPPKISEEKPDEATPTSVMVVKNTVKSAEYPADWAEGSIPSLISIIGEKSGLDSKEVVRRAQRKRRALGHVTLWMSLALVARDQGLEMSVIDDIIGEN